MMHRRGLLAAPALLARPARAQGEAFAALEARHGGRLGVAVLDTGSGRRLGFRSEERFPVTSTFKFLAAAQVLSRVDAGQESLDRLVRYRRDALVTYSPVTERHVEEGMTIRALCAAAVEWSDNTAGNLLLQTMGGPGGLTAWLRSIGDGVTRLDRWETALNEALPGDARDTTAPAAMLADMQKLLLGEVLRPASRTQLAQWLVDCQTGAARLRAGAPAGWRVGDKTGGGERNTTNDIAVFWPPGRAPVLVTAYYTDARAEAAERNAVLAAVGRIAAGI